MIFTLGESDREIHDAVRRGGWTSSDWASSSRSVDIPTPHRRLGESMLEQLRAGRLGGGRMERWVAITRERFPNAEWVFQIYAQTSSPPSTTSSAPSRTRVPPRIEVVLEGAAWWGRRARA